MVPAPLTVLLSLLTRVGSQADLGTDLFNTTRYQEHCLGAIMRLFVAPHFYQAVSFTPVQSSHCL